MTDIDYIGLGLKIKAKRKAKEYTQEKLAELCDISPGFLCHIEAGTRAPALETLYKISNILGVSTDYLLLDTTVSDDTFLLNIGESVRANSPQQYDRFCKVVKVLAEHIEEI
jgi:transcriptional regulator with XRE-family HTH domain